MERILVTVLMATLNGEKFLNDQMKSLWEQEGVEVEVYANDDGSIDGTLEILEKWRCLGLVVSISQSKGLGPSKVYAELLKLCDEKSFVAFCDQDDIWSKDRLNIQVRFLTENSPSMSICMREYIDEDNKFLEKSSSSRVVPSFLNATVENVAPGNTILLNNSAVRLLNEFENPNLIHYDSWFYLLVSAYGEVNFIARPLVQYRIHKSNSVGLRKFSIHKVRESVSLYLSQTNQFYSMNTKELSSENQNHLKNIVDFSSSESLLGKIKLLSRTKVIRQSKLDSIIFKLIMLCR